MLNFQIYEIYTMRKAIYMYIYIYMYIENLAWADLHDICTRSVIYTNIYLVETRVLYRDL